jgi:hypothetical protein
MVIGSPRNASWAVAADARRMKAGAAKADAAAIPVVAERARKRRREIVCRPLS